MDLKNLIPWNRGKEVPLARMEDDGTHSFMTLHREVDRLFDDFFRRFDFPSLRSGWMTGMPRTDVLDTGSELKVTVELPGLEEKDIELTLRDDVLTIRGEKKSESDSPTYAERWYGQFQRSIQLGPDVDPDKVKASVKNGILTITAQKKPESQRAEKRIPISS